MKHIFLASFQLDPSTEGTSGGFEVITKSIKELGEAQKNQIEGVKGEVTKLNQKADDALTTATEGKVLAQKNDAKLTEIEQKMNTQGMGGNGQQIKSFADQIEEKLTQNKSKLPLTEGKKSFNLEIETKVVGNMGSTASLTGSYFVAPTVVPGIVTQPFNTFHMRNLLSTGNTNSNIIRHLRDNGGEGGPAMVAEAAAKPQMDRDLSIEDAPVRKIATHLRVPEEMIEDIPYLTSFLTNIGTEEVLAVEDAQILYGDGTGQNISGLGDTGNFTAFASPAIVADPNRYDVLGASSTQMRMLKRNPSYHLVSPIDYYTMTHKKDTTFNYILQGGGNGIVPVTAGGVQVIQMNQITAGDFFTIDSRAAQIFFRSNITVRFYEQDQDNAIKNLVTIVIEERLALPIYFVSGIIKGTFAAAITDLTS